MERVEEEEEEEEEKEDKKEGEVKLRLETAITGCDAVWQKYRHNWVVPFVTVVPALVTDDNDDLIRDLCIWLCNLYS